MSDTPDTKIVEDDSIAAANQKEAVSETSSVSSSTGDSENYQPDAPPPASISTLFSMLTTQALVAMGQLAIPGEAPAVRLDYAKYYIDLLDVLEEKTRRNLMGHEADLLKSSLYQLRMLYVEATKAASNPS
jgi:Domain of unknown function (DUF1844)